MGNTESTFKVEPRFKFTDPPVVGNKAAVNPYKGPHIDFYKSFEGKDDEALLHRAYYMTKWTSFTAALFTICDTVLFEETATLHVMRRSVYYGIPFVGGGIVYVATAATACSLRKKDDLTNHVIAGYMTGAFLATRCRPGSSKWGVALVSGTALALVGSIYRSFEKLGWRVFPSPEELRIPQMETWWGHRWDMHTSKDEGYNWVAAPKEESGASKVGEC